MAEWTFDRDAIGAFRFTRRTFDAATGDARLGYTNNDSPEQIETHTIHHPPKAHD